MSRKVRIAFLICSTRPSRFDDVPARWMLKQAQAHADVDVETGNLRDHPLPFFAEVTSNMRAPTKTPKQFAGGARRRVRRLHLRRGRI